MKTPSSPSPVTVEKVPIAQTVAQGGLLGGEQLTNQSKPVTVEKEATVIRDWADLAQVPDSETHSLAIDVKSCNGRIYDKINPKAFGHYLSTHTFYGSKHEYSTALLRKCGFNVTLANWDANNENE